jgi:hypothetical protein
VTRYYFLPKGCCRKVAVLSLWGALSDERTGLHFAVQSLNGPSRSEPVTILYYVIWDSPNLEVQVPIYIYICIYTPRNRVTQLYPRALGSLYVASCYSQGCGGSILTRFQTANLQSWFLEDCNMYYYGKMYNYVFDLNLGVCILLRVLDQVQGFPSNATLFQNFLLLFYSNYPLHASVVRPSSSGNIYIGN